MEIGLDCLPCVLRQILDVARMSTPDIAKQEKIMQAAIRQIDSYTASESIPELVMKTHQAIIDISGSVDPYRSIKKNDIAVAKKLYPRLLSFLREKDNDLYWVLKTAAVGNSIDSAMNHGLDLQAIIEAELEKPFAHCDLEPFQEKLETASTMLIIGDNAGETVFDRVLTSHFAKLDIFYAAREKPIINDATIKEAVESGLDQEAAVISSGCAAPGTILKYCSREFLEIYDGADIVISKGQGNFEALSGTRRPVFFLLKAKCPVIASQFNLPLQSYVFKYSHNGVRNSAVV